MANKIVRLTESDLSRLVRRVIEEQNSNLNDRQQNIFNTILSLKPKNPSDKWPTFIITNPQHHDNGKTWTDYVKTYNITTNEILSLRKSANDAKITAVTFSQILKNAFNPNPNSSVDNSKLSNDKKKQRDNQTGNAWGGVYR